MTCSSVSSNNLKGSKWPSAGALNIAAIGEILLVYNTERKKKEDDEEWEVTFSRGLLMWSDLALTLSTKISITKRPITAKATYDVISFRTALGAAPTSHAYHTHCNISNRNWQSISSRNDEHRPTLLCRFYDFDTMIQVLGLNGMSQTIRQWQQVRQWRLTFIHTRRSYVHTPRDIPQTAHL